MTVARELAGWATALRLADIPPPVRAAAGRHLLDGLGTAVAAARTDAAAPAVAVALGMGGPPESTIIGMGGGGRVSAPAAALATGTLVHALDFDDTHAGGLVHATAVVLPAALAVGQQVGASGAEVLRAAVVGYEVVCRLAAAAPHGFHARGVHATSACGTLGAAAVAATLLGLDESATVNALGIAGSSSGGLLEFLSTGSATKQLHPGSASLAGILAARLAAAGATGPDSVIEGPRGLYAALTAGPSRTAAPADPALVTKELGTRWETTRIGIKPYPACQLSQAALDAARQVLADLPAGPTQIEQVRADVHPDSAAIVTEPRADKLRPRTAYDAKFSLPWSLAALLIDGELGPASYDERAIRRADVAALAERVRIAVVDPGDGQAAADAPGRVVVRLRDGRALEGRVPRSAGGPDHPLSDEALRAKLTANCGGPSAALDELARRVATLEEEAGVERVVDLAGQLGGQRA